MVTARHFIHVFICVLGLLVLPLLAYIPQCNAASCGVLGMIPEGTLGTVALGDGAVIDTDLGSIVEGATTIVSPGSLGVTFFTQPSGFPHVPPELCVFDFAHFTILTDATVTVVGSRGLALIASNEITVLGLLDLSGGDGGAGAVNSSGSAGAAGAGGYAGGEFTGGQGCVLGNGLGHGPGAGEPGACGGPGGDGGDGQDGDGGGGGGSGCAGAAGAGASHASQGLLGGAGVAGSDGDTGGVVAHSGGAAGAACSTPPQASSAGFPYGQPDLPVIYGGSGGSSGGFGGFGGFGGWGIGLGGTGYGGSPGFSGGPGGGGGGGGVVLICSHQQISIPGSIHANGGRGGTGSLSGAPDPGQSALFGTSPIGGGGGSARSGTGGPGGGGAGGSIYLSAPSVSVSEATLDVSGGFGGNGFPVGIQGAAGGAGRNGGAGGGRGASAGRSNSGGGGGDGYLLIEEVAVGVDLPLGVQPGQFWLAAPSPNPTRGAMTRFSFGAPRGVAMELSIYDLHGRRVATLMRGASVADSDLAVWNGRNEDGEGVAAGVYLAVLRSGAQRATQKFAVLR